jgi:hypothetical protein
VSSRTRLALLVLALAIGVGLVACRPAEGFAIYQLKSGIKPGSVEAMNPANLLDTPLIASQDIVFYDKTTHSIDLTDEAFKRVSALRPPTSGSPFTVCVDGKPVYTGAFWTPISSASFDGVVIEVWPPLDDVELKHSITLHWGYPDFVWARGTDPRSSPEVLEALARDGKLN